MNKLPGSSYSEIVKAAHRVYNDEAKKTKRQPYVRSKYFGGEKVFIGLFWNHLNQKSPRDRKRRLKYLASAFNLLKNSTQAPIAKPNPNGKKETVYRFGGVTKDGDLFYVQVKENSKGRKDFMSAFPPE
jgi:hypothetical protein